MCVCWYHFYLLGFGHLVGQLVCCYLWWALLSSFVFVFHALKIEREGTKWSDEKRETEAEEKKRTQEKSLKENRRKWSTKSRKKWMHGQKVDEQHIYTYIEFQSNCSLRSWRFCDCTPVQSWNRPQRCIVVVVFVINISTLYFYFTNLWYTVLATCFRIDNKKYTRLWIGLIALQHHTFQWMDRSWQKFQWIWIDFVFEFSVQLDSI